MTYKCVWWDVKPYSINQSQQLVKTENIMRRRISSVVSELLRYWRSCDEQDTPTWLRAPMDGCDSTVIHPYARLLQQQTA